MKIEATQVLDEAMHLPCQVRAYLAEKLLESLDREPPPPITEQWREEIQRRCEQIDSGEVDLIPADDVFETAYEEIG